MRGRIVPVTFAAAALSVMAFSVKGAEPRTAPADPDLIPEARRLLRYFEEVRGRKVLAGISHWGGGPRRVLGATGREPAIYSPDIGRCVSVEGEPADDARIGRVLAECRRWWLERGGIVALQFHWGQPGEPRGSYSVKKNERRLDLARAVTPGTQEHRAVMADLRRTADCLAVLAEDRVPVLWRPLHEIDGGWFWWTDKERPENTAALWRLMFNYFVRERKLHNLIWVYSAAHVETGIARDTPYDEKMAYRRRFYPGDDFVDLSGIDIYVGLRNFQTNGQRWAFDAVSDVTPGKSISLTECGAIPNPDLVWKDGLPWLYFLAWYGVDDPNPAPWMRVTFRHEHMLTLEEMPALRDGNVGPNVRIDTPESGSCIRRGPVRLEGVAGDRDGDSLSVAIHRLGGTWGNWFDRSEADVRDVLGAATFLGMAELPEDGRWSFTWKGPPAGCHDLIAVATDERGATGVSNVARIVTGHADLARGKPVQASSGKGRAGAAVDGDLFTTWNAARKEPQWLRVDLGAVQTVAGVGVVWWRAFPAAYRIDLSPDGEKWERVCHAEALRNWDAARRIVFFEPRRARYVRLTAEKRAVNWGGFSLFELLVFGPPGHADP
jgi:hypothetical protein